jgi:hypothetical protein
MNRIVRIAATLVLAGCTSARRGHDAQATGATVQGLIDSVLSAHGGVEALRGAAAYSMRGRFENLEQPGAATTFRTYQRPDRLRVVIHYPRAVEVRILNGQRGWRRVRSGMYVEETGPLLAAMRLQAARADAAWTLAEHRAEARAIAPLDQKGHRYPGLAVTLGDGLELRLYVDPATHLVTVSESALRIGDAETTFRTIYADYRPIDGVLFAFREENFTEGEHTGSTFIDDVRVNPDLGPETFTPVE